MSGTISTRQKCPGCGGKYPSSKGDFPIICVKCKTQPTKFLINLYWQGIRLTLSRDREGRTIHSWNHAVNLLGNIRSEIQAKTFDPEIYKQQSATAFKTFWTMFQRQYEGQIATHAKLSTIGKHHLDQFMSMQMRDIRAFHIKEWWLNLKSKGLSNHYMNDLNQWLKRFFNEATELDVIEKVPHFPPQMSLPAPDIEWLTEGEQNSVFDELPKYDRPIFDFMFLTGVRVGEAIAMHRSDIDFKKGRTIVQHTVKRDRKTIGEVKNKKHRIIPHVEDVEDCLRNALRYSGLNKLLFTNKWGRIYTQDYLRDTFKKACVKAGVKPIHLKNATRHSFGTQMVESGVDIWTTSKAMGHSDIKMTEKYAAVLAEGLKAAYRKRRRNVGDIKRPTSQEVENT
jgi:integrase